MITWGWTTVAVLAVLFIAAAVRHKQLQRGLEPGVVSAQLARTGRRLFVIFDAWDTTGRRRARDLIRMDWLIIVGYSPGLAILWLVLIPVFREADIGVWTSVGVGFAIVMSVCALGAGIADVIENRQLSGALDRWPDQSDATDPATRQAETRGLVRELNAAAYAATRAATWKFTLVGVAFSSLIVPLTVWLTTKLQA